jgi:hypothetical protein
VTDLPLRRSLSPVNESSTRLCLVLEIGFDNQPLGQNEYGGRHAIVPLDDSLTQILIRWTRPDPLANSPLRAFVGRRRAAPYDPRESERLAVARHDNRRNSSKSAFSSVSSRFELLEAAVIPRKWRARADLRPPMYHRGFGSITFSFLNGPRYAERVSGPLYCLRPSGRGAGRPD